MKSGVQTVTMDLVRLLEDHSDYKGWRETAGPDSGCGLDYWYEAGEDAQAYVNVDQGFATVTINDEVVFAGDLEEAGYAKEA